MKSNLDRQRGLAVVLVVGITMLISVMGVSFVRLASYDRVAANNACAQLDARLTAMAGIDHALAVVFDALHRGEILREPVLYPRDGERDLEVASASQAALSLPRGTLHDRFSYSDVVGQRLGDIVHGRYESDGNFYALKIVNEAGKLNVNSHIAFDPEQQSISNRILHGILRSLADRCRLVDPENAAEAIVTRPIIERRRFATQSELRSVIFSLPGEERQAQQRFFDNLCADSRVDERTWAVHKADKRELVELPSYYREFRAPVDANSASVELLQALFENIRAGVVFHEVEPQAFLRDLFGKEIETSIRQQARRIALDFSRTDVDTRAMAEAIVERVSAFGPIEDHDEFEQFVEENFRQDFFPPPPAGIPSSFWYQAWRDAVKSNCNPNVGENFFNPNAPYYRRVAAGDLFDHARNEAGECFPGHTTELSFFTLGPAEITSVGRVTAHGGRTTVAQSQIVVRAMWGEFLQHASQRDFERAGTFDDTCSLPNNVAKWSGDLVDDVCGGVEPRARAAPEGLYSPGAGFVREEPLVSFDGDGTLATEFSYFGGEFNEGLALGYHRAPKMPLDKLMRAIPITLETRRDPTRLARNHLVHDGLLSRHGQYRERAQGEYFATHAFSRRTLDHPSRRDFRSVNTLDESHIANYRGALELWIKLDEPPGSDTEPGQICGILGATLKNKLRLGTIPRDEEGRRITRAQENLPGYTGLPALRNDRFHEGTQMYLYINSFGKMRLSRLYYGYTFTKETTPPVPRHYGMTFARDADKSGSDSRGFIRNDIEVDVGPGGIGWQAHEWHHIRVIWNDSRGRLEIELDGRRFDTQLTPLSLERRGGFGVLNERDPRDVFFINGFFREEARSGGYFFFDTTIDFPGNGTVDRVVCYDSPDQGRYRPRYPNGSSYTGRFTIPRRAVLGPLVWIAHTSVHKDPADYSRKSTVVLEGAAGGGDELAFYRPLSDTISRSRCEEFTAVEAEDRIEYTAVFEVGEKRDRALECPTLDSVYLSLLYTYPKFLELKSL